MATGQASSVLFENVNRILQVYVPVPGRQGVNSYYQSMGVKSHGTITFSDNKSHQADFIRIPDKANVMEVKKFLNQYWYIERPSLVISITGGAKDYKMQPKVLRAFRRGILKVARTTGAWIITGGMNTGIMKLVGEIVQINPDRSRPIPLIGIATWGCVSGFKDLEMEGGTVKYAKCRSDQKGEAPLEPNHTKFIFVDDGSEHQYGGEIAFRAKLEQAISGGFFSAKSLTNTYSQYQSVPNNSSIRSDNTDPVPVVLLVVEGGPNTVRTVKEAVIENSIPAVFLEGTGRCCDLFAKACHLYDKYCRDNSRDELSTGIDQTTSQRRSDEIKNQLREELKYELRKIVGLTEAAAKADPNARADEMKEYFELVYECVHTRRNFLNVITLNPRNPVEPDIDLVILQALLNATSGIDSSKPSMQRKREQLLLALEWNRVDIAKKYIMKNEADWNIELNDLFLMALKRHQTEFVKLFLDHDFSLTDLFNDHSKLLELYTDERTETHSTYKNAQNPLRYIYEKMIQPSIGDFFDVDAALQSKNFTSKTDLNEDDEDETNGCCGRKKYGVPEENKLCGVNSCAPLHHSGKYMDVDRELFLWSVIEGSKDLALLFWCRGKNKVCAALIAALLYRKRYDDENDNTYKELANEFETLAVNILIQLYQADPQACSKAMIREIPAYGNATWLHVAIAADAKNFIAQKAVQDLLNDIWFGYIDQRESYLKIIFSTFVLFYSGFLRYHKELVTSFDKKQAIDSTLNRIPNLQRQASRQQKIMHRPGDFAQMRLLSDIYDVDNRQIDFVDVGVFEKTKGRIRRYFLNLKTFLNAPFVKYLYNLYFHMIFLMLFSYVTLFDLFPLYDYPEDVCLPSSVSISHKEHLTDVNDADPVRRYPIFDDQANANKTVAYGFQRRNRPSFNEILLLVWVFTLVCEELRQLYTVEAQSMKNGIIAYFKSFWNRLDVLAILLFFVGFALRFLPMSECYCAARIILSFDLALWFIRSLDFFTAVKRLGPKLVMIGEMVNDLRFFMLMLIVFVLAFGVSFYALVHGVQKFSWHVPREILNLAYWQIFGELNALEIFENNYRPNGYAAFILLVSYMAVVSILLVNLLIAMFSNTFDRLQTDTDRIWKFQRYSLVCEYLSRPSLPPPFIFFAHLWRVALCATARCCKSKRVKARYALHLTRTEYKTTLDTKSTTNIEVVEDAFGEEVCYSFLKAQGKLDDENYLDEDRTQSPQENILNRMRAMERRMDMITNQQEQMCINLEFLMEGLKAIGGDRVKMPEKRRLEPDESFDEPTNIDASSKRGHLGDPGSDRNRPRRSSFYDEQMPKFNFFPSQRS